MNFTCEGGCGAHFTWTNDWWKEKINSVVCDRCRIEAEVAGISAFDLGLARRLAAREPNRPQGEADGT